MRTSSKWVGTLLLSSVLVAPAVIAGCSGRVVTYHDPYYNDDHVWDTHETVYYTQWEHETHRFPSFNAGVPPAFLTFSFSAAA
jgi:hypothetical protein